MSNQAAARKNEDFIPSMSTQEVTKLYKDMVYAIALTHTRRRHDADDVFQEVFLAYHRKQPVFADEERRKAWLITTTLNCSRQLTGSSWSKKVVPLYGCIAELPSGDVTAGPGDSRMVDLADQEQDFRFTVEEQNAVFQAMRQLPSIYRSVLHLFYFEDLSIARIAEVLGIEPGTVRVQLSRGRAQMRGLLKGTDSDG